MPYPYFNIDSLTSAYLQYLCDNHPAHVKELLDQNRIKELDEELWVSVDPAWKFYHRRRAEGKSPDVALDLAVEALVPKEVQDPQPEPLSQEDQMLVRQKLDLRREGLQKLQALQEKRLASTKKRSVRKK